MGLGCDAELVWGIPVLAYNEDGGWDYIHDRYPATPFWDPEREDWQRFEGTDLYVYQYGHYEDPDNIRGILTSRRVEPRSGDCWTPTLIVARELADECTNDKLYSKSEDQARSLGLPVSFYADAQWWLVASFG